MKSIEYYCDEDFDPTVGQELSAPQYLIRKINAAKELKNKLKISDDFLDLSTRFVLKFYQNQFFGKLV